MQELRITAKGRDLLNKIVESKLTFSNMGLGKGVVEGWDNTILELVSQVMVKPITDVIVDENRQISFKAEFTNELLEEGFNINEIGVFARDPDLGEILFAYTNSYGEEVDYFAPGTGNKIVKEIIDITMAFNDATEVELVIDPNKNYATKKDIENLEYPEFDDSGTSEGISSFTDFMNSIKSKMNICQFFRNFKSGLKFIVHTGMIVDNYATKEKGFLPDATLVTALKEQLDEQNNNLNDNIKDILSKIDFIKQNYYCLQGGIEIPQYSDLNEYKQTGSYFCPWNAQTITLKNIPPIRDAFTLIVYYATGSREYIGQRLYNYWTGKVHYRVFNIYENAWTDWTLL